MSMTRAEADAHWARHFHAKAKRLEAENAKLRAALEEIAAGCGHTRCHAYPWIKLAQKALT